MAEESGIDAARFRQHFEDGSAEAAFLDDMRLTRSLGIRRLPVCLIQLGRDSIMVNGMFGIEGVESTIGSLLSKQGEKTRKSLCYNKIVLKPKSIQKEPDPL